MFHGQDRLFLFGDLDLLVLRSLARFVELQVGNSEVCFGLLYQILGRPIIQADWIFTILESCMVDPKAFSALIDDIYAVHGIRIGLLDLATLVRIAIEHALESKVHPWSVLGGLQGPAII